VHHDDVDGCEAEAAQAERRTERERERGERDGVLHS
jgi:hypothetical protein